MSDEGAGLGRVDAEGPTTDLHVEATYRLTEALVEAEARMRRRVELLSEIVIETDVAGRLIFLNGAWARTLGYEPDACLGRPLDDFIVDEDRPRVVSLLASAEASGPVLGGPIRLAGQDGGVRWMELSVARIAAGGTVGALHDVTDRKLAQDELAKLSVVASGTDNLVVITDGEGRTEWVNRAFTSRTGYTLDDVIGRTPGDVLQGPATDRSVASEVGARVRAGESFTAELLNYTKQGVPYWVQIQSTPITGPGGEIERFVSIQTDSTDLHRTQEALETARKSAEAASEAKTQFLATISHEMRTPLSAIIGSIDLALEGDTDPSETRSHLHRISESAEVLKRLISDVLDVAKIEAGQIDVDSVPVDIRQCLRSAIRPIAEQARVKGLDFKFMVDEALPTQILGDPDRIRQIVTNLAENAVKFTEAGYVRIDVSRQERAPVGAEAIEIRVADSGVGVPLESQARIFERFVQGDASTTRRKGGAGLGLGIVRSLAEALGGAVSLESRTGSGADFRVTLPLLPVTAMLRTGESPVHRSPRVPAAAAKARILVAEDNDLNFAVLESCLTRAGYAVARAVNGREAIAGSRDVDLILMDVEMPEMDGIEATRRIRAFEHAHGSHPIPILAVTAHAVQEYRTRCLEAGCTGYLAKPVRPRALVDAVAAALVDRRDLARFPP